MNSGFSLPRKHGRLLVRDFTPEDRPVLLEISSDTDLLKYMRFNLSSEKEVDEFLDFVLPFSGKDDRTQWHLALEHEGLPGFIGSVALMVDEECPQSAELGYWFRREAWGKGYATEASRLMLHLGFRIIGLHRIWGMCHVANPESANVMKKLGMVHEGTIREHVWLRDHFRSSEQFSILENEYKE